MNKIQIKNLFFFLILGCYNEVFLCMCVNKCPHSVTREFTKDLKHMVRQHFELNNVFVAHIIHFNIAIILTFNSHLPRALIRRSHT